MEHHAALVVMDVQQRVFERYVQDTLFLFRVGQVIRIARRTGIPVLYVAVGLKSGHPEVSVRTLAFSGATQFHLDPAPQAETLVVTKRRVSAFAGSDLEANLEALGVDSLVLAGVATGGVLQSTLRQATDLGFKTTVLADACLGADPEVHRVLMAKVFPRHADVFTVEQWEDQLTSCTSPA